MFMQSVTEIHCLKAMGAYLTGKKKGDIRNLGNGITEKA